MPLVVPPDTESVSKELANALQQKMAFVTGLADAQRKCEECELALLGRLSRAEIERLIAVYYVLEDTTSIRGKYIQAVSKLAYSEFHMSLTP